MAHASNKTGLYEALGQIVVSFSVLEQRLDCLLASSLKTPLAQNAVIIKGMSFAQKVTIMNDLICELHSECDLGALNHTLAALVERCHSCELERNNWVRAYWVPEAESQAGQVMCLQYSAVTGDLELVPVKLIELDNFIVLLNATIAYLSGFHQKLFTQFNRLRDLSDNSFNLELVSNSSLNSQN